MEAEKTSTYILGHAEHELQRLEEQGQYWGEVTVEVLQRAGLAPGMRVLDVGCGAGDLSLIAANLVGPSGSVLGIDRSPEAVQRAAARAASYNAGHVHFEVADVESMDRSRRFDAVIGRFILMYMAHPAATLRRLIDQLGPAGIVAFIEMDMWAARSVPPVPKVETAIGWVKETFRRAGVTLDLGPQLWQVFREAGLQEYALVVCQKLDPATSSAGTKMLAEIVRSLLPVMEMFGVATGAEVGIETLAAELQHALLSSDATLLTPCVVEAYSRMAPLEPPDPRKT